VACRVMQALGHAAIAMQSTALSGLASLSDGAHAVLPPARQQQLWTAVAEVLAGAASPKARPAAVQAAAARAVGALAALPSFVHTQLGAGLCKLLCSCWCYCSNAALASTSFQASHLYMQCDAVLFESSSRLQSE
jgi:hypothetical protein